MGKSLNARPTKALNQRPGSAPSKSIMPNPGHSGYGSQAARPTQQQAKPAPYSNPYQNAASRSDSNQAPRPAQGNTPRPAQRSESTQKSLYSGGAVSAAATKSDLPGFVNVMKNMVGSFAILSDEVLMRNLELASGKGMSNEDRTISFECADYLMSNLGYIFMGLVLDMNFKDAFMESILIELKMDEQPADVIQKTRAAMKDSHEYKSAGSIVIGVTTFMPAIETDLMNKMQRSFDALDRYSEEFDAAVANLTEKQKVEYGFMFSNFMYLIRAFMQNDMFMSYIITVIEKVKETLSMSK